MAHAFMSGVDPVYFTYLYTSDFRTVVFPPTQPACSHSSTILLPQFRDSTG
jgi:hypothetical protein